MASNAPRRNDTPSAQVRAFAARQAQQPVVPPPPNYAPTNGRQARPNRSTKVNINKVSLVPDLPGLPPLSFSFNKTVVHGGGAGYGGGKAMPGSGFTSDEDIRAFSEAIRKDARPRAVERALDAETLESVLRSIPDINGSLSGSRARARRVARHLKRIAAAEKLIAKQAAALYASFTLEFEAELAQISNGRRRGQQRHYRRPNRNSGAWKQW
jgi:hypothetical protein